MMGPIEITAKPIWNKAGAKLGAGGTKLNQAGISREQIEPNWNRGWSQLDAPRKQYGTK